MLTGAWAKDGVHPTGVGASLNGAWNGDEGGGVIYVRPVNDKRFVVELEPID